jgi:fluoride exporter
MLLPRMLVKLLWLALAGVAGTLARYSLQGLVQGWSGSSFPWGTWAVNALGCFLFGVVWALGGERMLFGPNSAEIRTIILVGFMGAFTTFSSFAAESGNLLADKEWAWAAGNILLQNVSGIGLFFGGLFLGRWI